MEKRFIDKCPYCGSRKSAGVDSLRYANHSYYHGSSLSMCLDCKKEYKIYYMAVKCVRTKQPDHEGY